MYNMLSERVSAQPEKTPTPVGRPRAFVPEKALHNALDVFWRQGFEVTSLDDLTRAMQLSRSSFYASFGTKREVFLAAIQTYTDEHFAAVSSIADSTTDPLAATQAVLATITDLADADGGGRGCFFVNSVTALAPHDDELAACSHDHITRVLALLTGLLVRAGFSPRRARDRAGAALALAMGSLTLRKAGVPAATVKTLLKQMKTLLAAP